jgi:hypothetical protein
MPPTLIKAHNELDKAVDSACRTAPFTNEANRMVYLFELYEKYIADLFTKEKPKKKNNKPKKRNVCSANKLIAVAISFLLTAIVFIASGIVFIASAIVFIASAIVFIASAIVFIASAKRIIASAFIFIASAKRIITATLKMAFSNQKKGQPLLHPRETTTKPAHLEVSELPLENRIFQI